MRGRADQPHGALLDIGQQQVLLRFVETMQLVDEKDGRRLRPAPGRRQNPAQFRDIGHDGVDPHEPTPGLVGDGLRDARLAAARRPVKEQGAETVLRHEPGQQRARLQNMRLPDHLAQLARPHPRRQRPPGRPRRWSGGRIGIVAKKVGLV
jgi:hypothetical protein